MENKSLSPTDLVITELNFNETRGRNQVLFVLISSNFNHPQGHK